ncbi:MAG: hypothetical protein MJZ28_07230 [Paludibacteraceae bacterium]|nr:hypothetical protein [Paludibacteraceae bacterium]
MFAGKAKTLLCFCTCVLFFPFVSCDSDDSDDIYEDYPHKEGCDNILRRIDYMADIEWIPLKGIPTLVGSLSKGSRQKGLIYSSVKEIDKSVGYDVSMETFLTAVKNIDGCLYNENLKDASKQGNGAAAYYGTVCSGLVGYAYGLKMQYPTHLYDSLSCFEHIEPTFDNIELCDALWEPGHVVIVSRVFDRNGKKCIETTEANGEGIVRTMYNSWGLLHRYKKTHWRIYRLKDLRNVPEAEPWPIISDSYDILTYRGDKVTYRQGEEVVLNILSKAEYTDYVLVSDKDSTSFPLSSKSITLTNLPPGSYRVYLRKGGVLSKPTFFEVLSTFVKVTGYGAKVEFSFASLNATPIGVKVCLEDGTTQVMREFNEQEINTRVSSVTLPDVANPIYLKVFFQGKYGRVTNEPIRIK